MNEHSDTLDDRELDLLLAALPLAPLPPGFRGRTMSLIAPRPQPSGLRLLDVALPLGSGLIAMGGWLLFLWLSGRLGPLPAAEPQLLSTLLAGGGVWLLLAGVVGTLLLLVTVAWAIDEQTYFLVPPAP
jgi:hypothetical protein